MAVKSWSCDGCAHIAMFDKGLGWMTYCEIMANGGKVRKEWREENGDDVVVCLDYLSHKERRKLRIEEE